MESSRLLIGKVHEVRWHARFADEESFARSLNPLTVTQLDSWECMEIG